MFEKDRALLSAVIATFDELEKLYRSADAHFLHELQQASGLSVERLRRSGDALKGLQQPSGEKPSSEKPLFATLPESEQVAANACPQCKGTLEISTNLEPDSQRGYVMVVTQYTCRKCGYHDLDRVSLPSEIALQQDNLEALMNVV